VADSPRIAHAGELAHDTLAYVVYAAVTLHIAATAWHAMAMRDGTLAWMWPRSGNRES
jgi:cytochrome b561